MASILPLLLLGAHASTAGMQPIRVDGMLCHPRRLLAKLEPGAAIETLAFGDAKLLQYLPEIRWVILETPPNRLQATREAVRAIPGVERVTLDRAALPAYTPNDPMWSQQWSLPNMKVDLAWDLSLGANSSIVAVIDTGVDVAHPDLSPNVWVNVGEIAGNNVDDDHNGYVDDVNGYDFAYGDSSPNDVFGHGTSCAGIAAGRGDNSLGLSGVAPRARIMAIKAAIDSGYFYDSATAPAYLYCANNGAKTLSMSYYSDRVSPIERDGINYCWNHNILPVAAAGNDATIIPFYPANYDNVVSVAALNSNNTKAGFSNYGAKCDVAAGGVGTVATTVGGGYTAGFSGTSAACPHVAGVAALLKGANPNATNAQIRYAIEDNAVAVNQAPFGEYCNYGRVDAQKAMQSILGTPAPPRTPVVRFVSMLGNQPNDVFYDSEDFLVARIYGRGFQAPNTVEVSALGQTFPILAQTRDYIEFEFIPPALNPLVVKVNGATVTSLTMPNSYRICYPMSECSTPSASTTGGFREALTQDALFVRCTRQTNGSVFAQTTFHKVQLGADMRLRLRRSYTGANGASVETIRVYDWSSASYPYGTYVQLSSGPAPLTATTSTFTLPNAGRFLDDERTVYVEIETTGIASGGDLRIDEMNIQSDR